MNARLSPGMKTLLGTVLAQFALGSVYTWSLFNAPLAAQLNEPVSQVAFTFGIMTLALALASSVSGHLQARFGVRRVTIGAGLLLGASLALTSVVGQLWLLYLTAGLLIGLADGTGYLMTLSNCVRFFPKNKGLASACAIGAYGLGSLGFKYINLYFLAAGGAALSFQMWAVLACVMVVIGGALMHDAPQQKAATNASETDAPADYTLSECFKTPQFWLLATVFVTICMSGLYVIGVAKDVGELYVHLDAATAAEAVAIIALANLGGRLVLGVLSDRMARSKVVGLALLVCAAGVGMLRFMPLDQYSFYLSVACVAFSFGGAITVFPTLVSDYFGMNHLSQNYGFIYLGFGVGSFMGSVIAALFGGFIAAFSVMLVMIALSLCIAFTIQAPKRDNQAINHSWQLESSTH
ncbi:hypothetical protein BZJ17_10405 [Salinivibrio sp. IB574]|uniref:OFA family MFS transporter n=1 Tax=Salinivibrio sp. IB574 TaxID=1909444 RepID=UPI00098975FE|nr:OFA family MFS transporter [Salinivibrio sp. IB574]OOF21106.1 hypothetical protein BZJ17_10405 [Salinivibrio sp. IB574]